MTARRALLLLLAAALLIVAARQALRWMAHVGTGPAAHADWIWAEQRGAAGTPVVFFAVKDFELDFEPREAEVRILADEEYQLTINGRGLGAGRYRSGAPLDVYPVGRGLHRGSNRLVVELRSARGAGGLLLRLEAAGPDGQSASVVSDRAWRIVRRYDAELLAGGVEGTDEEPVVWGQPAGRWGAPAAAPALTLRRLQGDQRRDIVHAARMRRPGGRWEPAPHHSTEALGAWVSFDFGGEQTGFLNLRFGGQSGGSAFAYYALRQPHGGLEGYDEVILRAPGRDHWTASAPARFRYVTIVAAPEVSAAELVPVDPRLAAPRLERDGEPILFGIESRTALVTPVEDEVRRQLEGVARLAGREEG